MKRNRWIVGGLLVIALIFITVVLIGRITSRESLQKDDDIKTNIELTDNGSEGDSTKTETESFEDVFDEEDSNTPNSNEEASKEDANGEKTPSKEEETDGEKTPSKEEENDGEKTPSKEEETETDTDESQLSEEEDTETKYGEIY